MASGSTSNVHLGGAGILDVTSRLSVSSVPVHPTEALCIFRLKFLRRLVHLCPFEIPKTGGCCVGHCGDYDMQGRESGPLRVFLL